MAIIVLPDVLLPNSVLAAGVRGKNMRQNSRVPTDGGFESVNIVWTQTLRQYELGIAPMRAAQWQAIEAIHEITEGGAYGFLMEDPKDRAVSNGVAIDAAAAGTYQLYKRYTDAGSGRTKDRKITRPRAAGFAVSVSGSLLLPAAYSLDEHTGILTIPAAPLAANIAWAGIFYVPVHFLDDSIDWELVAAGPDLDGRFLSGPSLVLQEVRE